MHAPEIPPIFGLLHQSGAHGILADVLPLLGIVFSIAQSVMKTGRLKSSCIRVSLGEAVFPETDPTFDGEFHIVRCTEQMQVVRHQQIIAHEPSRGGVQPDIVQNTLDRRLCQPALAFIGADSQENPVHPAERKMNPFGWRVPTGFTEWSLTYK